MTRPVLATKCSICGAGGKIVRGWCDTHYMRWKTHGDPLTKLTGGSKVGQRYGRWTVVFERPRQGRRRMYLCICDCGTVRVVAADSLYEGGGSLSCGICKKKERDRSTWQTTHGHSVGGVTSPTYNSWDAMRKRCLSPNHKAYPSYGAKGITVCERWATSFENFLADMGVRPQGTSLDRIDSSGNYTPENCRWATALEQGREKRKLTTAQIKAIANDTRPARLIAADHGVSEGTIYNVRHGRIPYLANIDG